jgi:ADP-L-glycero-D-manno-heptose 6-epimerase
MRYVVTGGAGFIGSNIVAELETRGLGPIVVIDEMDRSPDQWLNLAKRSLHGLIAPRELWPYLEDCPEDCAIIHMAARSSTADTDADALIETNAMLTARLFEYCAIRAWPFVYASSASVYGTDHNQSDQDDPDALAKLRPLNPYAWSKALADKMVVMRASGELGSPPPPMWAGLRFFNVYGAGEAHKGPQRSFISQCFDAIKSGQPIKLFRGSENFRRDWVWVDDVARLVVDLFDLDGPDLRQMSGIYNVGTGATTSFTDVAAACIEASGRIAPVSTVPFPDALHGRYQSHTQADMGKLKTLMPDFHFVDLKEGATRYWQAHAARDGMGRYP